MVGILVFGVYSAFAVLYGVFTFKDCPEEAASLRKVRCHSKPAQLSLMCSVATNRPQNNLLLQRRTLRTPRRTSSSEACLLPNSPARLDP